MKRVVSVAVLALISIPAFAGSMLESAKEDFNAVLVEGKFKGQNSECEAEFIRLNEVDWKISIREQRPDGRVIAREFSTERALSATRNRADHSETPYVTSLYLTKSSPADAFIRGPYANIQTPDQPAKSGWFIIQVGDDIFAGSERIAQCGIQK